MRSPSSVSIPAVDVTPMPQVNRSPFPEIATLDVKSNFTNKNFPDMRCCRDSRSTDVRFQDQIQAVSCGCASLGYATKQCCGSDRQNPSDRALFRSRTQGLVVVVEKNECVS